MRKPLIFISIFCFGLGSILILISLSHKLKPKSLSHYTQPSPSPVFDPRYNKHITIGGIPVWVEIVDTQETMQKGLSGRKNLKYGTGMLFVYRKPQMTTFWMPDMNFPIDIIFLKNYEIIQIEANVPNYPSDTLKSELPRYSSKHPVDMVLEVPAGWAEMNLVTIGTKLKLEEE